MCHPNHPLAFHTELDARSHFPAQVPFALRAALQLAMASSSSAPVAAAPAPAVPVVVNPCFIAQLPDLEPAHKTRITAWAGPRCREFRIIPSATGTVVCGILVAAPATARKFLRLWLTLIKTPPGDA